MRSLLIDESGQCLPFVVVDPSTASLGWSVWAGGLTHRLERSGALPRGWAEKEALALLRTAPVVNGIVCLALVIEDQFMGRNPASAIRVIEARMRVEVVARLLGWKIARVPATTWQSAKLHIKGEKFPTRGKEAKRALTHVPPTEVLKERSIALARKIDPKLSADIVDDQADAIVLGEYVTEVIK